ATRAQSPPLVALSFQNGANFSHAIDAVHDVNHADQVDFDDDGAGDNPFQIGERALHLPFGVAARLGRARVELFNAAANDELGGLHGAGVVRLIGADEANHGPVSR